MDDARIFVYFTIENCFNHAHEKKLPFFVAVDLLKADDIVSSIESGFLTWQNHIWPRYFRMKT